MRDSESIAQLLGGEMEDLDERLDQLKLTEKDNAVIEIGTGHLEKVSAKGKRSLVGKLLSDRRINQEVIRSTLAKI